MRTQLPIVFSRPTMQSEMSEKPFTVVPSRMVAFLMRVPGPTLHPAPMLTFRPSWAEGSTSAVS